MKWFLFTLISCHLSWAWGLATICHESDDSYSFEIPSGYIMDLETAIKTQKCAVLYPSGTVHAKAPMVISLKQEPLPAKTSFGEFITQDMKKVVGKDGPEIETEPELRTPQGMVFHSRRARNLFTRYTFEGRAYYQGSNKALVANLKIKSGSDFPLYEGAFKEFLMEVKKLPPTEIFKFLKDTATANLTTPTGKNFNSRYLNSVLSQMRAAIKTCGKKEEPPSSAVVRISEKGEIVDWFNEKSGPVNDCLKKELIGARGTKAPFEPFHLLIDFKQIQ